MSYKVTRRGYIQLVGEPRGEADYGVECNAIECSGFRSRVQALPRAWGCTGISPRKRYQSPPSHSPSFPHLLFPLSPVLPLSPSTFHTFWHFSYQSPSSNSPSYPSFHFPFSPSHISILLSSPHFFLIAQHLFQEDLVHQKPHFFSSPRKRHQSPSISASIFSFSLPSISFSPLSPFLLS